jgi:uncharacterized membrane protein
LRLSVGFRPFTPKTPVWLFGNLFPQNKQTTTGNESETAVTILKKRYASGEISKEEFETMRHDLEQ